MWAWGRNDQGQCGVGPEGNVYLANQRRATARKPLKHPPKVLPFPVPLTQFAVSGCPIQDIACGCHHSAAVGVNGMAFVWGNTAAPPSMSDSALHQPRFVIARFQGSRHRMPTGVTCEAAATYFVSNGGDVAQCMEEVSPLKAPGVPSFCEQTTFVPCKLVHWKELTNKRFSSALQRDADLDDAQSAQSPFVPDYKCLGLWSGWGHTVMLVEARRRATPLDPEHGGKESEEDHNSSRSTRSRQTSSISTSDGLARPVTVARFLVGWGRNVEGQVSVACREDLLSPLPLSCRCYVSFQLGIVAPKLRYASPTIVAEHEKLSGAAAGNFSTAIILVRAIRVLSGTVLSYHGLLHDHDQDGVAVAVYGSADVPRRNSMEVCTHKKRMCSWPLSCCLQAKQAEAPPKRHYHSYCPNPPAVTLKLMGPHTPRVPLDFSQPGSEALVSFSFVLVSFILLWE